MSIAANTNSPICPWLRWGFLPSWIQPHRSSSLIGRSEFSFLANIYHGFGGGIWRRSYSYQSFCCGQVPCILLGPVLPIEWPSSWVITWLKNEDIVHGPSLSRTPIAAFHGHHATGTLSHRIDRILAVKWWACSRRLNGELARPIKIVSQMAVLLFNNQHSQVQPYLRKTTSLRRNQYRFYAKLRLTTIRSDSNVLKG